MDTAVQASLVYRTTRSLKTVNKQTNEQQPPGKSSDSTLIPTLVTKQVVKMSGPKCTPPPPSTAGDKVLKRTVTGLPLA